MVDIIIHVDTDNTNTNNQSFIIRIVERTSISSARATNVPLQQIL